jgi:hypothetical protein
MRFRRLWCGADSRQKAVAGNATIERIFVMNTGSTARHGEITTCVLEIFQDWEIQAKPDLFQDIRLDSEPAAT